MITAQVVLINQDGLVLGVSRKDDHTNFGLAGGKMEDIDNNDPMATAIRECKEETGLDVTNLRLAFAIHKDGNMGYTYLADYEGEINHDEPHVVKWVPFQVLINGRFGKYNKMVSESLDDMGIKYQMDIDVDLLKHTLTMFVEYNDFNGYKISTIIPHKRINWLGHSVYELELHGVPRGTCDFDTEFSNGLKRIGDEFGVKVEIPNEYYSK